MLFLDRDRAELKQQLLVVGRIILYYILVKQGIRCPVVVWWLLGNHRDHGKGGSKTAAADEVIL
jgi:hypothetical protein